MTDRDRLVELAREVPPGPWAHKRSSDGALILWDGRGPDAEPLALIYAGLDLVKYLEAIAPAVLLDLEAGS